MTEYETMELILNKSSHEQLRRQIRMAYCENPKFLEMWLNSVLPKADARSFDRACKRIQKLLQDTIAQNDGKQVDQGREFYTGFLSLVKLTRISLQLKRYEVVVSKCTAFLLQLLQFDAMFKGGRDIRREVLEQIFELMMDNDLLSNADCAVQNCIRKCGLFLLESRAFSDDWVNEKLTYLVVIVPLPPNTPADVYNYYFPPDLYELFFGGENCELEC